MSYRVVPIGGFNRHAQMLEEADTCAFVRLDGRLLFGPDAEVIHLSTAVEDDLSRQSAERRFERVAVRARAEYGKCRSDINYARSSRMTERIAFK